MDIFKSHFSAHIATFMGIEKLIPINLRIPSETVGGLSWAFFYTCNAGAAPALANGGPQGFKSIVGQNAGQP